LAPPSSRLGQLQRGRGAGFVAALEAGPAAIDEVLRCAIEDPRVDRELESRGRYLGELLAAQAAPLDALLAALRDEPDSRLGHEVLAAAAACGHPGARALLADERVEEVLRAHVALWLVDWEVLQPVALAPALRAMVMEQLLDAADSASIASGVRRPPPQDLTSMSVEDLLELARTARAALLDPLQEELRTRTGDEDRDRLWQCLRDDPVHGRVKAAARALGAMGDERVLTLCEELFAREDVFEDPARRLPGLDRMRRSALAGYVRRLPGTRQLELARAWHPRGGYFAVVAATSYAAHAEPDDRAYLEGHVAADLAVGTGWDMISELDALARLADPSSAPLLVEVSEQVAYSHARRRAVRALAVICSEHGVAAAPLREALWDSEDEAAADACGFLPELDAAAALRVRQLARLQAAEVELQARARRRLERS